MKKIILTLGVFALIASCSSKEQAPSNPDMAPVASQDDVYQTPKEAAPVDPTAAGLALIEASDCRTCHHNDNKLIGPSYQEVADKYTEADIDYLAEKILDGGKGVWGEVPMTPHPGMSKEDARGMVKYILSLKG
ncbi:MAG TPA: c-type cytochrome [Moheibacter sp.]|nr:c-type cytochrome [Moheibacter sp.]